MKELAFSSIKDLKERLAKKEISVEELFDFYIQRFNKYEPVIKSSLEIFDKDSVFQSFKKGGILSGIPGILKDNICQKGRLLTCGSKILENYVAPYDASVVTKLKNEGALLIGRGNLDEFAMGSSTETSAFQKTANPWDITRVPGGSSGGSAAAVSAGLVPWGLGSETGGSVRLPASFCGIVGMKPTYGLVSRYGLVAYASSLDQIGPFTRTVYDNALVLSAIAGKDSNDSTTLNVEPKDYTRNLTGKLKEGLVLGVIDNALEVEGFDKEIYDSLDEALKVYEKLGAKVKRVRLPMMDKGAATYFVISRAEAASNLARFDGVRYGLRTKNSKSLNNMYMHTRFEGFGPEVQSRILVGNYVLSSGHADEYYKSAKIVQGLIRAEYMQAFEDVDILFSPVTAAAAFKFGTYDDNKLQMDLQDYFTASVNLAGIPSLAVPCGFTKNKLPIGFQLIGPDLSEELLYQTAYAYEQETKWYKYYPENFA